MFTKWYNRVIEKATLTYVVLQMRNLHTFEVLIIKLKKFQF